jgi:predicted RNase H-like nuclease
VTTTTTPPSRRGPNLPYSLIAGVTPCGRGWLVASAKVQGTIFAPEAPTFISSFVDVLDQRPAYSVIALNAPVGYLDFRKKGGRTCDREARLLLRARGAAIQSAPVRVSGKEIELAPENLDAISRTLLPRYREVAAEMAPFRQRTVYEVHSDLSFYQLNGEVPLRWSKHSEEGIKERRTLLEEKVIGVERILEPEEEVPVASPFHLIDVAAFLWTSRRIFNHAAIRVPSDPEWDEQGLRMEMYR